MERSSKLALKAVGAVLALVATTLSVVPYVAAAGPEPFECSVAPADGGVMLTWGEVRGAASYQYKSDVDGSGSVYRRVTGTSVLIPVADGKTATLGMSPIFEDGSTQPRSACGSAQPIDGTGPKPLTCSVASADGGIEVSWNEIDGAVTYAWKLSVEGESPKYRRVKGTTAFIALPAGMVGSVSVTPVFADRSIRARSQCGSAGPNEGTGNKPLVCSLSAAPNGVLLEWSEVGSAVHYQYKLIVEGQGPRYRRVTGSEQLIELPAGTTASVALAPVFADGSTMPRASCGTATAGDDPNPTDPVITSCRAVDVGNGIRLEWTAENLDAGDAVTWKYTYEWIEPGRLPAADVGRAFGFDDRSVTIFWPEGTIFTRGVIEIELLNGEFVTIGPVDCGTAVVGGVPGGPGCFVAGDEVNFDRVSFDPEAQYELLLDRSAGASETVRVDAPGSYVVTGASGDVIAVRIQALLSDGTTSLATKCGTVTIPTTGLPRITSCTATDVGNGFRMDWTAENTDGSLITWRYDYAFISDGQDITSDVGRAFENTDRAVVIPASVGSYVTNAAISVEFADGEFIGGGSAVDCGVTVVGGTPSGPPCTNLGSGQVGFGVSFIPGTASYELLLDRGPAGIEIVPLPRATQLSVPGGAGETIEVRVRTVFEDGSRSLETACGSITIPPGQPDDFGVSSCSVAAGLDDVRVDWVATVTQDISVITWRANYSALLPDGSVVAGIEREDFLSARRLGIRGLPEGSVVTVSFSIEDANGDPNLGAEPIECGTATVGGELPGPAECDTEGFVVTWPALAGAVSYSITLRAAGEQDQHYIFIDALSFDLDPDRTGLSGTYEVLLRGELPDGSVTRPTSCGQIDFGQQLE